MAWRKKGGGNPRWVRKASREMVPTTRIYPNAASTVAFSALDMDMLRDSNTFNALIAKDERLKGKNDARSRGMNGHRTPVSYFGGYRMYREIDLLFWRGERGRKLTIGDFGRGYWSQIYMFEKIM